MSPKLIVTFIGIITFGLLATMHFQTTKTPIHW